MSALSEQTGLPTVNLESVTLDPTLAAVIPLKVADKHRVVPLGVEGKRSEILVVAIGAPASLEAIDAVHAVSRKSRVIPRLASDDDIAWAIDVIYHGAPNNVRAAPLVPLSLRAQGNEITLPTDENRPRPHPSSPVDVAPVHTAPAPVRQSSLPLAPRTVPPPPSVALVGLAPEVARELARPLAEAGLFVEVATTATLAAMDAHTVAVVPLMTYQVWCATGGSTAAQVILVGGSAENDLARAVAFGAKGFVESPIDGGLLVHSVRRCLRGAVS
jgi:type IV pilus assembly protein PilB